MERTTSDRLRSNLLVTKRYLHACLFATLATCELLAGALDAFGFRLARVAFGRSLRVVAVAGDTYS